jgi:tRNA A-37 threonylcarbamoyl transferase component Bud32
MVNIYKGYNKTCLIGENLDYDKVFKFCRSNPKYQNEKYFYLTYNKLFNFIPELLDFDDDKKLLVLEKVGEDIDKKDIDFIELKKLNDILIDTGIYQNDFRSYNILYNKEKNKYYIIDFEKWSNVFEDDDHKKIVKKYDIRNELLK